MRRVRALLALAVVSLATAAAARAVDVVTPVLGEQRVLVVLVTWGPEPFTQAQVRDVVFRGASDFFRASSYGRTHLAGDVTPWLHALGSDPGCNQPGIGRVGRAAAAAAGYAPATYDELIYIHPDVGCPWTGLAQGREAYFDGELYVKLAVHELGHTFGLAHANASGCGEYCAIEYGDPYDSMGGGIGDFNVYEKYRLGWLPSSEILWDPRPGAYVLDQLEVGSPRPHAIVIRTAKDNYWVENRRDSAQTVEGAIVGPPGVLVRTGSPERYVLGTDLSAYDRLVADPTGRGRPAMLPGERYLLPGAFSLTFVSRLDGRARLRFAWTDRTPPGAVRNLAAARGEDGLGLQLTWGEPRETGSGVVAYRVTLDKRVRMSEPYDPRGLDELALPALAAGRHVATVVAVDRAGNRSRAATVHFTALR